MLQLLGVLLERKRWIAVAHIRSWRALEFGDLLLIWDCIVPSLVLTIGTGQQQAVEMARRHERGKMRH